MAYNGPNPPTALEINKAIAALDDNNGPARGCRFIVRINLPQVLMQLSYSDKVSQLIYACDAAEFPGRSFQVSEVRYYGPKMVMPGNTTYGDSINLSFMCRSNTVERQLFDDWMDVINPPNSYHFKFPNEYWTDIEVFQYAEFGSEQNANMSTNVIKGIPRNANPQNKYEAQPIYGWKIMKAWPVALNPQQVTWADSDILRLQVSFAYKSWTRQGDSEQIAKKISR